MQAVSTHPEGYTLSELTKVTGIPVGTISPILRTLVDYRFLEFNYETKEYTVGIQSYYIGSSFTSKNSTLALIRTELISLSEVCRETCQLGILKEGQVFYLLKVEGQEHIRVVSEVGGSLPAYATALGKAILSSQDDKAIDTLYGGKMQALTPKTITNLKVLKEQLQEVRESGFAREHGESSEHTACIAVPICQNQEVVAALSVVYPTFRETEESSHVIEEALMKYKYNIEKILVDHILI